MIDVSLDLDPDRGPAPVTLRALRRFLPAAQNAVVLRGDVAVLLCGDAEMRRLNRNWRGKNKSTDVLSFPAPAEGAGGVAGDLAISIDTAQRQADEHGHALLIELKVLTLHGLLHLAGMDHEADHGEMAAREAVLRKRFKLPLGLLERSESTPPRHHTKSSRGEAKTKLAKAARR